MSEDGPSHTHHAQPASPSAPQPSPLTPVPPPQSHETGPQQTPVYIDRPPTQPLSLQTSTDAIALGAALSSLQIQKQRAANDLQTLQHLKQQALARPLEFQQYILNGGGGGGSDRGFESIPAPQQIVRCPPINWAKYHVVGGALDALHDRQRERPDGSVENTASPAVVAAAYDPFQTSGHTTPTTAVATGSGSGLPAFQMQTRRSSKIGR